jgi:hypothetical protein
MSRPDAFNSAKAVADDVGGLWVFAVEGLVAGSAIYLLQANVLSQGIHLIILLVEALLGLALLESIRGWLRCVMQNVVRGTRYRVQGLTSEGRAKYLDYAWATYHATSITGWLTLVLFGIKADCSVLATAGAWYVVTPGLLLVAGSLWIYAHLYYYQTRFGV